MTIKTMVSTEALEPGDLVAHEDIPEHVVTGRVARLEDAETLIVTWMGMPDTTSVPSNRLRLIERPEAYVVVEYEGLQARTPEEITINPYTFVVTGCSAEVSNDVAIYQDVPRYKVVSFRIGRQDSPEEISE